MLDEGARTVQRRGPVQAVAEGGGAGQLTPQPVGAEKQVTCASRTVAAGLGPDAASAIASALRVRRARSVTAAAPGAVSSRWERKAGWGVPQSQQWPPGATVPPQVTQGGHGASMPDMAGLPDGAGTPPGNARAKPGS